VSIAIGLISITLGLIYIALGVLAASEMISSRKQYGVSRFGVGYILMAISCGPHHLLHGNHVLHGQDFSTTVAAATLLGVPSGLVFIGLRIEALFGGRGYRFIEGTPTALMIVPLVGVFSAGVIAAAAFDPSMIGAKSTTLSFQANAFVVVTYALVAWPLLRTQFRRRPEAGGWSVSGLAVATIFPTCALMHLVYALDATGDLHTKIAAVWGVPASVYYLWVVRSLHHESIADWNSQPITGQRRLPVRAAPWDEQRDSVSI